MVGDRHDRAGWRTLAACLALSGLPTPGSAANDRVGADIRAVDASSFAAKGVELRYGFYRLEPARSPASTVLDALPSADGLSTPGAGASFSSVAGTLDATRPPEATLAVPLMPAPEPNRLPLLLAGLGLFALRGSAVWRQGNRRNGGSGR